MKWLIVGTALLMSFPFMTRAAATEPVAISVVKGAPSTAQPQGRFELLVSIPGSNGGIFHTWQVLDQAGWNSQWTTYTPIPDNNPHGLVSGIDGNGRIAVAWISKGAICFKEAIHANESLSPQPSQPPLTILPIMDPFDKKTHKFTYLAIATNPNGLLEVLALTDRGRVFSIKEASLTNSNLWLGSAAPTLIGGGDLQSISVTTLKAGLALAAVGKDGKTYAKFQTIPGTWDAGPWQNLDGNKIQEVHASESSAHQLELLALGADGNFYLQFQTVNSSNFAGWQMLTSGETGATKFGSTILFDRAHDGTLFLVTHQDLKDDSQYLGTFQKGFQAPNNGSWIPQFVAYSTVLTTSQGTNTNANFGWLNRVAFAMSIDAKGAVHYFAARHDSPKVVEEYVDPAIGASTSRSILPPMGKQTIPTLP